MRGNKRNFHSFGRKHPRISIRSVQQNKRPSWIRTIVIKKGLLIKKGPPIGVKNFLGGGLAFLINRNLEIGRRPKILSILSRKMKGKRVFRAFGAPQAPKNFACGVKIPITFSIFRY